MTIKQIAIAKLLFILIEALIILFIYFNDPYKRINLLSFLVTFGTLIYYILFFLILPSPK